MDWKANWRTRLQEKDEGNKKLQQKENPKKTLKISKGCGVGQEGR